MTLPRLRAYNREWAHNPPVALAVARFLGYKPARRKSLAEIADEMHALGIPQMRAKRPPPGFFIVGEDGKVTRTDG